jgi:hypothetical protein
MPRAIAWLALGVGLLCPFHAPQSAVAGGGKPLVHVFLHLDAKSSVVKNEACRTVCPNWL